MIRKEQRRDTHSSCFTWYHSPFHHTQVLPLGVSKSPPPKFLPSPKCPLFSLFPGVNLPSGSSPLPLAFSRLQCYPVPTGCIGFTLWLLPLYWTEVSLSGEWVLSAWNPKVSLSPFILSSMSDVVQNSAHSGALKGTRA